jgi:hypothetical protein
MNKLILFGINTINMHFVSTPNLKRRIAVFVGMLIVGFVTFISLTNPHKSLAQSSPTFSSLFAQVTNRKVLSPALNARELLTVDCTASSLMHRKIDTNTYQLVCGNATVSTSTPTPTMVMNTGTSTPIPTKAANVTTIPTPSVGQTNNNSNWSIAMGQWSPNPKWDTCTKEQHDSYNIVGPDGKIYPTWHPLKGPNGCNFGHEHGVDPRLSRADSSMPAFGYAAAQMGMLEAHAGFKVHYANRGDIMDPVEGDIAQGDMRLVFHMGTAGVKRYTEQFHSLEYDMVLPDGSYARVQGLADTGNGTGSACTNPRDGGRDFSTVGCDDSYEIWAPEFQVWSPSDPFKARMQSRFWTGPGIAAFDPITTRDPNDNTRILYSLNYYIPGSTVDPTSTDAINVWDGGTGGFAGCRREFYNGGDWANTGKANLSTIYYTDVYGKIISNTPQPGLLKQEISQISRSVDLKKKVQHNCANGIHAPN